MIGEVSDAAPATRPRSRPNWPTSRPNWTARPRSSKPTGATWTWSAPSCSRALEVLRERLVAIYESGTPDVVNAILESASWSEVATPAPNT